MAEKAILFCVLLIIAIMFKNFATFDSRPIVSIFWGLCGALIGPLVAFIFPITRKNSAKFFGALSIVTGMLFFGFGFLTKSQINKDRFKQILNFPAVQAKLVSCRVGEESPGRYRRPEGRFFPIWNYQYHLDSSNTLISSFSDSLPDFSIRQHFKSETDAKIACQKWIQNELRTVYFDPTSPELSLLELPKEYRAYNVDLFLGSIFSIFSIIGIAALLKTELKKKSS